MENNTARRTICKNVTPAVANAICANLTRKGLHFDGFSGCERGAFTSQTSFHFRRNDGSAWARLGHGPTYKLVSLIRTDRGGQVTASLVVEITGR